MLTCPDHYYLSGNLSPSFYLETYRHELPAASQLQSTLSCRVFATNMPPTLENLIISIDSGIAIIRYNRPANANALNGGTMQDLLTAFTWALHDPEIKVVVLTGLGKFFSVGMDLVNFPAEGPILPDSGVEMLR
jgi:Enoyl-CoA hydratase/isomerase